MCQAKTTAITLVAMNLAWKLVEHGELEFDGAVGFAAFADGEGGGAYDSADFGADEGGAGDEDPLAVESGVGRGGEVAFFGPVEEVVGEDAVEFGSVAEGEAGPEAGDFGAAFEGGVDFKQVRPGGVGDEAEGFHFVVTDADKSAFEGD